MNERNKVREEKEAKALRKNIKKRKAFQKKNKKKI